MKDQYLNCLARSFYVLINEKDEIFKQFNFKTAIEEVYIVAQKYSECL